MGLTKMGGGFQVAGFDPQSRAVAGFRPPAAARRTPRAGSLVESVSFLREQGPRLLVHPGGVGPCLCGTPYTSNPGSARTFPVSSRGSQQHAVCSKQPVRSRKCRADTSRSPHYPDTLTTHTSLPHSLTTLPLILPGLYFLREVVKVANGVRWASSNSGKSSKAGEAIYLLYRKRLSAS